MIPNDSPLTNNGDIDVKPGLYAAFECVEKNKADVQFGLIKDLCDDGRVVRLRRLKWPLVKVFTIGDQHEEETKNKQNQAINSPADVTSSVSNEVVNGGDPLKEFEAARKTLTQFTDTRFIEIGRYVRPASLIVSTFQAVCQILESSSTPLVWSGIQPIIRKKGFLKRVLSFDALDTMEADQLKKVCKASSGIRVVQRLSCSNEVAIALQRWVRALYDYSKQKLLTVEEEKVSDGKASATKKSEDARTGSLGRGPVLPLPSTSTSSSKPAIDDSTAKVIVQPKIESVLKSCMLEIFQSMGEVVSYKKSAKIGKMRIGKDSPSCNPDRLPHDDGAQRPQQKHSSTVGSSTSKVGASVSKRPSPLHVESSAVDPTKIRNNDEEAARVREDSIHKRLRDGLCRLRQCNEILKNVTKLSRRSLGSGDHESTVGFDDIPKSKEEKNCPNSILSDKTSAMSLKEESTTAAMCHVTGGGLEGADDSGDSATIMSLLENEITVLHRLTEEVSAERAEVVEDRVRSELSAVHISASHTEDFLREQKALRESMALQIADLHFALKESQQHLEEVSLLYQDGLTRGGIATRCEIEKQERTPL